jgi:hypothetical protein
MSSPEILTTDEEPEVEKALILILLCSMLAFIGWHCFKFFWNGYRLVRGPEDDAEQDPEHVD